MALKSSQGLWRSLQKMNKQSSGRSLSPLLSRSQSLQPSLLTETTIGCSRLCSVVWTAVSVPGAERRSTGWRGLEKKSREGNHICQPFWALCLTVIHPPAGAAEQTQQPCSCRRLPGHSWCMAHAGYNGHLFAGWAKAEILRGWDINH